MKHLFLNLACIAVAIFSGVQSFLIKYQVIEKENQLRLLYHIIAENEREVHVLRAEWAYLNDPKRIKTLISAQTSFQPISVHQITTLDGLPDRQLDNAQE